MAPKTKKNKAAKTPKLAARPSTPAKNARASWINLMPVVFTVLAVLLAGVAVGLYALVLRPALAARAEAEQMPPIGASFSLLDDQGQMVTEKNLANGHDYHLIFFGFTSCPDICPTMLNTIMEAMKQLPAGTQDRVKTILVSIDPRRDTPSRLRSYLDGFDKRFIGWTGPKEELDRMTKGYLAFYSVKDTDAEGKPLPEPEVNHSSVLYLMGPDGKYVTHMSQEDGADGIARRIAEFVK